MAAWERYTPWLEIQQLQVAAAATRPTILPQPLDMETTHYSR